MENKYMQLLRRLLQDRLGLGDLRNMAFDLDFDFDNFMAQAKDEIIVELLSQLEKRDKLDLLLAWIQENRTDIDLSELTQYQIVTPQLQFKGEMAPSPNLTPLPFATPQAAIQSNTPQDHRLLYTLVGGLATFALIISGLFVYSWSETTQKSPDEMVDNGVSIDPGFVDEPLAQNEELSTLMPSPSPSAEPTLIITKEGITAGKQLTATASPAPTAIATALPTLEAVDERPDNEVDERTMASMRIGDFLYDYRINDASHRLGTVGYREQVEVMAKEASSGNKWLFVRLKSGTTGWVKISNVDISSTFDWSLIPIDPSRRGVLIQEGRDLSQVSQGDDMLSAAPARSTAAKEDEQCMTVSRRFDHNKSEVVFTVSEKGFDADDGDYTFSVQVKNEAGSIVSKGVDGEAILATGYAVHYAKFLEGDTTHSDQMTITILVKDSENESACQVQQAFS